MNKISIALGLLLSSSAAFASKPVAPQGTGNFRRAEVLRAAGAKSDRTYVKGVAIAAQHIQGTKPHVLSRVSAVSTGGKVTLVKAPIDKRQPVTKLTPTQARRYGLVTQAKARQMARFNGGDLASKHIVLADMGLSANSYKFRQVSPDKIKVKLSGFGTEYLASGVTRTVTLTGTSESASASRMTRVQE